MARQGANYASSCRLDRLQDRRPGSLTGYLAEDCELVADFDQQSQRPVSRAARLTSSATDASHFFAAAGPLLWNSLPITLRQCHSLERFKRLLKTFLFSMWSHGALWHLPKSVPHINPLTYLLTYLLTYFVPLTQLGTQYREALRE